MLNQTVTDKLCKVCGASYRPYRPLQAVCSPRCARKVPVIARKAEIAETKRRKEAVKTRSDWIKETQVETNKYVRLRDIAAGHGCIDCGKPFEPQRPGGSVDAGHYLSRSSAPHLRFDDRNIFAQRKNCNRPGGTTREAFRAGVVARIGEEMVAALERDQSSPKWSIEDLKSIRDGYRAKTRALMKGRGE